MYYGKFWLGTGTFNKPFTLLKKGLAPSAG